MEDGCQTCLGNKKARSLDKGGETESQLMAKSKPGSRFWQYYAGWCVALVAFMGLVVCSGVSVYTFASMQQIREECAAMKVQLEYLKEHVTGQTSLRFVERQVLQEVAGEEEEGEGEGWLDGDNPSDVAVRGLTQMSDAEDYKGTKPDDVINYGGDVHIRLRRDTESSKQKPKPKKNKRRRSKASSHVYHLEGFMPKDVSSADAKLLQAGEEIHLDHNGPCRDMKRKANSVTTSPNADGVIRCWQEADWLSNIRLAHSFQFNSREGTVEVFNEGLYYIYSQIHYHNAAVQSGHGIYVDNKLVFGCYQSVDSASHNTTTDNFKHKTCYTGGVYHLKHGHKLQIKDEYYNRTARYLLMEPGRSFWGLYKVQDVGRKRKKN